MTSLLKFIRQKLFLCDTEAAEVVVCQNLAALGDIVGLLQSGNIQKY